jgi:hypothetical protein
METKSKPGWERSFKASALAILLLPISMFVLAHPLDAHSSGLDLALRANRLPASAPTETPGTQPPASPVYFGDGNGDRLCTEVDALMALKMAVGLLPPDVTKMDVDGDGEVTEVDALQILKWAVTGGQCGGISPAQSGLEEMVKTEAEAIKVADELISKDFPDMVGADKAVQSYATQDGEFYDVTYKRTEQIDSAGKAVELPRVVIVSIDKNTGEQVVAVSG